MSYKDIVPYTSVFIDASLRDFLQSSYWCINSPRCRNKLIGEIEQIFQDHSNLNSILPCLSVRSGLDLFLSVHSFLPGSEIIMSAINIPSIVKVIHSHGLEVKVLDVNIETMKPKLELLESLITSKTRFLLLANIYGRGFDVGPFSEVAKRHNLLLIEDWAEGFSGFDYLGHPESDLSLFSFGPIKYYTAYGGAIAKVKDVNVYHRMRSLHESYPMQSHADYMKKVMKLALGYMLLNCPRLIKPTIFTLRKLGINYKEKVIGLLRGFPKEMMKRIRQRPCNALLATLKMRMAGFSQENYLMSNVKAEYALTKLPSGATMVGMNAETRNHWLFPVLVKNPEEVIKALNNLGVDAYRGATQLDVVKSDRPSRNLENDPQWKKSDSKPLTKHDDIRHAHSSEGPSMLLDKKSSIVDRSGSCLDEDESLIKFPIRAKSEAEYLMQYVIYLPINKTVPFEEIDKICLALSEALITNCPERGSEAADKPEFERSLGSGIHMIKSKL